MSSQYFDASTVPVMRTTQLVLAGGKSAIIVEIGVPPCPSGALAIVLDMSDSCSDLKNELRKLPKWVEAMPGNWALWVYRVSEPIPLQEASSLTIGDIHKQLVNPVNWLANQGNARAGFNAGSLIGPVLEAVEQRRQFLGLDFVAVFIFSDGELLDFVAPPVPASLAVVGISPETGTDKMKHWHRVLAGHPLYSAEDSELADTVSQWAYPFHGQCEIVWQCGGRRIRGFRLNVDENSMHSLDYGPLTHTLSETPAYLVFETSVPEFDTMQIKCVFPGSGATVQLSASAPLPPLPPTLVQTIESAMIPGLEISSLPRVDAKLA